MSKDKQQNGILPMPQQSFFIEHHLDGTVIAQRPVDGYINATAMCKKAGKELAHYNENKTTKSYLAALSADIGIPMSALIQALKGGIDLKAQATWVHPKIAIHLAQWLSPQFAVQVSNWVFEWIKGDVRAYMPPHVKRYILNRGKIPPAYFSMLNEIYLGLLAPLEDAGFVLPDKLMPDISTGQMFSKFLRDKGVNPNDFPTYEHEFINKNRKTVYARLYPIKYLEDFRNYFNDTWMPTRSIGYFETRAPEAVPIIERILLPYSDNNN